MLPMPGSGSTSSWRRLAAWDRAPGPSSVLERGKVFLNGREASVRDAGTTLKAGDSVRVWMDRPGSAKRAAVLGARSGDLPILFEDEALIVVNKPAGLLAVPLERKSAARVGLQPAQGSLQVARQATPVRRASHRSRYVGSRAVREGRVDAGSPEGAVQAPRAGARLPGGGLRPPGACRRHLAATTWSGIRRR